MSCIKMSIAPVHDCAIERPLRGTHLEIPGRPKKMLLKPTPLKFLSPRATQTGCPHTQQHHNKVLTLLTVMLWLWALKVPLRQTMLFQAKSPWSRLTTTTRWKPLSEKKNFRWTWKTRTGTSRPSSKNFSCFKGFNQEYQWALSQSNTLRYHM